MNVIDGLYGSLNKVQKKQFEQAGLGFLAKGEEIGNKKGRVEELKRLLKEMDFSQNRAECGFCKTVEQVNAFIEYEDFEKVIKKRLKELEK